MQDPDARVTTPAKGENPNYSVAEIAQQETGNQVSK
jgi:hypothetical protein